MKSAAPSIEIATPFTISSDTLNGFDYTVTPVEYLRHGIGCPVDIDTYDPAKSFEKYNDSLNGIAENVNIQIISINLINIGREMREFITFLITINRYTITPTEALTAEQEWRFSNEIYTILESIKRHPLKPFFTCENMQTHQANQRSITICDKRISLPDIYIWVDEFLSDEDELKILKYIDQTAAFYRERFNAAIGSLTDSAI